MSDLNIYRRHLGMKLILDRSFSMEHVRVERTRNAPIFRKPISERCRNPTSLARLANMFKEETNSTSQRPGIGMLVNYDTFRMDRNSLEARSKYQPCCLLTHEILTANQNNFSQLQYSVYVCVS